MESSKMKESTMGLCIGDKITILKDSDVWEIVTIKEEGAIYIVSNGERKIEIKEDLISNIKKRRSRKRSISLSGLIKDFAPDKVLLAFLNYYKSTSVFSYERGYNVSVLYSELKGYISSDDIRNWFQDNGYIEGGKSK